MFGVFIRSIDERTENLCFKSCVNEVDKENIFIIKNKYPAYLAYQEMFIKAKDKKYNWFLGLDADVILIPNWLSIAKKLKDNLDDGTWFVFSCAVRDKFLGMVDRGNHFYNGEHIDQALEILENKTQYMIKPETSICKYIGHRDPHFSDRFIGYHGYEQYNKDILYRFWLQAKRKRHLENIHLFLKNKDNNTNSDNDFNMATLGWKYGKENWFQYKMRALFPNLVKSYQSDASIRDKLYSNYCKGNPEKEHLVLLYEKFINERSNEI